MILGVAVAGLVLLLLISLFVTDKNPTVRLAAQASAWGLSVLLIAFFALAASATSLRWPSMPAALLGIEDGVVCARPGEPLQAFSCGGGEGSYVVVNIRMDDADSGLMVRESPGHLWRKVGLGAGRILGAAELKDGRYWHHLAPRTAEVGGWQKGPVSG